MTLAKVVIKTIGRSTLRNAVESALKEGFEVIVVNDNPEFKCDATVGHYRLQCLSQPVDIYNLPKAGGEYGAVAANVGAAMNDAEYTVFLDDDDEFIEGAGDIIRSQLEEYQADMFIAGLKFNNGMYLCCNEEIGFQPGNVAMVTYRTDLLRKIPMQYFGERVGNHLDYYDYFHALHCKKKGASYKWYGVPLYNIRPKLQGTNGRGK